MATRTTVGSTPALELAGTYAGSLRSLQMPGYRIDPVAVPVGPGGAARQAAKVSISGLDAEFDPVPGDALCNWVFSLASGKAHPADGAALLLDVNLKVTRRVEWTAGRVTALRLPVLDATQTKVPFTVGFSWLPATVTQAKAPDQPVKIPAGVKPATAMLCSNFRVLGLPFDGSLVARVVLPTVTAQGQVEFGELRLEFASRSREDVLAWVQKVVSDGQLTDSEHLNLSIELLDPALKKVLATLQLSGAALLGYEETRVAANQETLQRVALRFTVGSLDFKLKP